MFPAQRILIAEYRLIDMRQSNLYALPNLLTYGRCLAVPVVVAFLFLATGNNWARWWALGLFVAAAITDYFDGYLAPRAGTSNRHWARCSIRSPTSCSLRRS